MTYLGVWVSTCAERVGFSFLNLKLERKLFIDAATGTLIGVLVGKDGLFRMSIDVEDAFDDRIVLVLGTSIEIVLTVHIGRIRYALEFDSISEAISRRYAIVEEIP